jgi:transcriptional regulator with XRE-family HTH domain
MPLYVINLVPPPVFLGISALIKGFALDSTLSQCQSRHIASPLSDVCCGPRSGSARYRQLMATMMAPVEQREVLRCDHCSLVQFRTANALCRRCHKCLEVEEPEPAPAPLALVPTPVAVEGGLQVATAVRDLRHVRNLSQRQLAARMGVPRTYISKIENGKAMPTLSSLDRLARALQVDISTLLRDSNTRHRDETAVLMTDPFLAEIAMYTSQLDDLQRSIFLNHVRELAAGRRRTA